MSLKIFHLNEPVISWGVVDRDGFNISYIFSSKHYLATDKIEWFSYS